MEPAVDPVAFEEVALDGVAAAELVLVAVDASLQRRADRPVDGLERWRQLEVVRHVAGEVCAVASLARVEQIEVVGDVRWEYRE